MKLKFLLLVFSIIGSKLSLAQNRYIPYYVTKLNKAPIFELVLSIDKESDRYKLIIKEYKSEITDSLNKKEGFRDIYIDQLNTTIYSSNGHLIYKSGSYGSYLFYDGLMFTSKTDSIYIDFDHGRSYEEKSYYKRVYIKLNQMMGKKITLEQDHDYRIIRGGGWMVPTDYQDPAPVYNIKKHYLDWESGKILKGKKLLRKYKLETLDKRSSSFHIVDEEKLYYNKIQKKYINGKELIKSKKIVTKEYDEDSFENANGY